jgi:hypothetical protein
LWRNERCSCEGSGSLLLVVACVNIALAVNKQLANFEATFLGSNCKCCFAADASEKSQVLVEVRKQNLSMQRVLLLVVACVDIALVFNKQLANLEVTLHGSN